MVPACLFSPANISLREPEAQGILSAAGQGESSFLRIAVSAPRAPAAKDWFLGFEGEPSPARWECGNRAVGDFQAAVGNLGNRRLVFQVFHGPVISTALRPSRVSSIQQPHPAAAVLVRQLRGPHLSRWP